MRTLTVRVEVIRCDMVSSDNDSTQDEPPNRKENTLLPGSISRMHLWLQDCQSSHTLCSTSRKHDKGWCPTRVIDIGPVDSTTWRLECTIDHKDRQQFERYIALSYRWGRNPSLLLLLNTIDDFRHGKLIDELPRTFRDVVRVAKNFNVRYLWIDALCIIQDSSEDWSREALKMHQVYANSLFTIAATASADENDGLFKHLDSATVMPGIMSLPLLSTTNEFRVYQREYWQNHISQGPLHRRGWVFQERHLSRRVLYFGKQVLWECLQAARCEVFLDGMPHHASEKALDELFQLRAGKRNETRQHGPEMTRGVYCLWRNLVRNYVLCSFTKIEDKLVAFAGIAQVFYEATGDQYLAGLWRSHIKEGLDWRVHEPVAKSSPYRAPSWSWASIDGPARPELATAYSKYPFEVLDAEVKLENTNPMSKVLDGHLIIKAWLLEGYCDSYKGEDMSILRIGPHFTKARLHPDVYGNGSLRSHKIYMFPLHSFLSQVSPRPNDIVAHVVFIWLERTVEHLDEDQDTYSRVGHFVINDERFLSDVEFSSDEHGVMVPSQGGVFRIFKLK